MTTPASVPARPAEAPQPKLPFPLQEGEQVIALCRRHWLYLWPSIALKVAVALVPPAVAGVLLSKAGGYTGVGEKIFWVLADLYLAYWAVRIFFAWYRYHNDVWVITNQRIIDSLRTNPFNLRISSADLVNVQDMTVERSGPLRTLFDFGDVVCQTAADVQEFRISGIPDPRAVQTLVDKERDRERLRYRA
jgi:membrane protein YdbS with pleckstrin-like domain